MKIYIKSTIHLIVSAWILGCRDHKNDLASIRVERDPADHRISIYDTRNALLFGSDSIDRTGIKEMFSYTLFHPIWNETDLKNSDSESIFLLNYYALTQKYSDSSLVAPVNSLLKKLRTDHFVDFNEMEGRNLAKIILALGYNYTEPTQDGIAVSTIPQMPFTKNGLDFNHTSNIDSLFTLQKNGYFTYNEFSDQIKYHSALFQFSKLPARNATTLLVIVDWSSKGFKSTRYEISLYYQFLDAGILQIEKIDLSPFRNLPYYYE